MTHTLTLDWKTYRYEPTYNMRYQARTTRFDGLYDSIDDLMADLRENLPTTDEVLRKYTITLLNEDGIAIDEFIYEIASPRYAEIERLASKVAIDLYGLINHPSRDNNTKGGYILNKTGDIKHWEHLASVDRDDIGVKVPVTIKDYSKGLKKFGLINERGRFHKTFNEKDQICDHMGTFIVDYLIPRFTSDFQAQQEKEVDQLEKYLNDWI